MNGPLKVFNVSPEAVRGFHSSISTSALYVDILEYTCNQITQSLQNRSTLAPTTPAHLIPSLHSIACRTTSPAPPLTYMFFAPSPPRNFLLHLLTVLYSHNLHTLIHSPHTHTQTHNQHSHHTRTHKHHSLPHQQHHVCSSLLPPRLQVHRLHGIRHSWSFLCRSSLQPSSRGSRPIRCSFLSWWFPFRLWLTCPVYIRH
jgi:hypothetical protein